MDSYVLAYIFFSLAFTFALFGESKINGFVPSLIAGILWPLTLATRIIGKIIG